MPTYVQVPYSKTNTYSKAAYDIRMGWGKTEYSGRNAGCICFKNGLVKTAWSKSGVEHTEAVLLNCASSLDDVAWLYTELMPCGRGPGLRNCRQMLQTKVPNLTIYFTAPYYEGSDREPEATAILGTMWMGTVKLERADLNAEAKAWREDVATNYPIWHSVWGQDPLPAELRVDPTLFAKLDW